MRVREDRSGANNIDQDYGHNQRTGQGSRDNYLLDSLRGVQWTDIAHAATAGTQFMAVSGVDTIHGYRSGIPWPVNSGTTAAADEEATGAGCVGAGGVPSKINPHAQNYGAPLALATTSSRSANSLNASFAVTIDTVQECTTCITESSGEQGAYTVVGEHKPGQLPSIPSDDAAPPSLFPQGSLDVVLAAVYATSREPAKNSGQKSNARQKDRKHRRGLCGAQKTEPRGTQWKPKGVPVILKQPAGLERGGVTF
ncbi:hypothetical protein DAEQUDRAFT_810033 [Daedalea quercina L-15889]|uniref:Uncharacterized protein n=1 Tax=Daedalea quercina L-15889 TaxID=1314783 RepID=A0A165RZW6_9APHY|nr:hypothetical protein DAEQUDRAFT_810033 [Daedalea quercina L-15889]